MIVVCNACSTRLQLDDAKLPQSTFSVRCPKCQALVNVTNTPAPEGGATGLGANPAFEGSRIRQPKPAPPYKGTQNLNAPAPQVNQFSGIEPGDLAKMLLQLLQSGVQEQEHSNGRINWERRRVLVCVNPTHRDAVAKTLADEKYQVYLAEDGMQAIDRMREERMEVVILESDFSEAEQGFAFVTNEINSLRPVSRRRTILALMSPDSRSGDSHAAFVNNVNVVFNSGEIDQLPMLLERTMRDINEMYKDFNAALSVQGF